MPLINCLSVQAASSRGAHSLCLLLGAAALPGERPPLLWGRGRNESGVPCRTKQGSSRAQASAPWRRNPSCVIAANYGRGRGSLWALGWGLKAAQGWLHRPGECCGSVDPMQEQPKPRGGGSQLRHGAGLPHLSWQRRGKRRMFLGKRSWKHWKVKAEGRRGRTSSSSSPLGLRSFPSAATGCDVGPGSCCSLLVHIWGWRWSCSFLCTLPLSFVVPNPVHPSWRVEGGC